MLLISAHCEGATLVHLTHTTLFNEALCGEAVTHHGDPEVAVICEDCLDAALSSREDVSGFYRLVDDHLEHRIAA